MSQKRILFIVNTDWFFITHRLPIALAAMKKGYEVTIACNNTGKIDTIINSGCNYVELPITRSGTNIFKEIGVLYKVYHIIRNNKPNIIHNVSLKAIMYGSLLSIIIPKYVSVINAITGMGYVYINDTIVNKFIKYLFSVIFKISKRKNIYTIFQNSIDRDRFLIKKLVIKKNVVLIRGSGVDLEKYTFNSLEKGDIITFVLSARLLYDKGVREFVKASQIMKKVTKVKFKCVLVGPIDTENKSAIPKDIIKKWVCDGFVEWWGTYPNEDIPKVISNAHIFVLPSYHEGLPKALIEAGALGLPLITTDVPGCNEVVKNGVNGLLVPPRESEILAKKMQVLLENEKLRKKMGLNARRIIEKNFSLELIVNQHMKLYNKLIFNLIKTSRK